MHRLSVLSTTTAVAVLALGCADTAAPPVSLNRSMVRASSAPTLTEQNSGTSNRLQAVSAVNDRVVWASGVGGTYAVTTDGGATWHAAVVPGAEALEFRDVEAFSDKMAYLLAAGPGELSRIFRTDDGGQRWRKQFQATDPNAFYDCFGFWSRTEGATMADGLPNGHFPVVKTKDGQHWKNISEKLPASQPGEAAFAASGTCLVTQGESRAWIGTGGAAKARIIATRDRGKTWNAYDTPIIQGTPSSGVISVGFRDGLHGIIGAGELVAPNDFSDNIATSSDGGVTWALATRTPFPGSVYGLAYVKGGGTTVVATGPSGAAWTPNEGGEWELLEGLTNLWAVGFGSSTTGWLVGVGGRIVKVEF